MIKMLFATFSVILIFDLNSCDRIKNTISTPNTFFKQSFVYKVVDEKGPINPWGKSVGDLNNDGLLDLIVGGNISGGLVWYENPIWERNIISDDGGFSTDHEIADINLDGRNDVISLTRSQLIWFENPNWTPTVIADVVLHDIETVDLDGDGDIDIVGRNQSAFSGTGNILYLYEQKTPSMWIVQQLTCPEGEGLKVADINNDGLPDIVVNQNWYENSGRISSEAWQERIYSSSWIWPHVFVDVGDINNDGRRDIVLSPAERAGSYYRISWFEAPANVESIWREHIVEPDIEAVHHFVALANMDNDSQLDIVTAEMHQGQDPDEIKIYLNEDHGALWVKEVIAETGSHSMRVCDLDNDGDVDIFGANWSGPHQIIEMWQNTSSERISSAWKRHVIDNNKPWRTIFITAADLDGDSKKDIITGGWWYRNPGHLKYSWQRILIGDDLNNMAAVFDIDGDNDYDILGTRGEGAAHNSEFVWAQNNGAGSFSIFDNIEDGDGDFLQGVAAGHVTQNGRLGVALSWHGAGMGIQMLAIPNKPNKDNWIMQKISVTSQDEALSVGDIDNDGDLDLLMGTKWLRNDENSWSVLDITNVTDNPDRNYLADMNNDGKLDAVVGFEAISKEGKLAWYEQKDTPTSLWDEHLIATVIGPMSLDVADMDKDGDLDVIVGEHNLTNPGDARLFVFENKNGIGDNWLSHLVYKGDEHHDGAQVVDIDNDDDLDIISIGWGHTQVLLYENVSFKCKAKERIK